MEGEVDAFDFHLAERLGITLAAVEGMSNREYIAWQAWTVYEKAMRDMERQ